MATRPTKKVGKKTAFVPRMIFHAAAVVGTVPLCVAACSGSVLQVPSEGGAESGMPSVACTGFGPCAADVASMAFDANTDIGFVVACEAFDGGPCGQSDAPLGVASQGFDGGDAPLGVAALGFDASDDAG
jgi:hypothetical protein